MHAIYVLRLSQPHATAAVRAAIALRTNSSGLCKGAADARNALSPYSGLSASDGKEIAAPARQRA